MTIGIIDSGLTTSNPEFSGRISSASADVAGSRGLTNADDLHGEMVALVAAGARDGTGVMGMAFNATIAAYRADTPGSCLSTNGCSFADSAIATGINNAIAAGAKVINISLGGSSPNAAVISAVGRAASAGVVIVVSAGNDGGAQVDDFAAALRAAGNGNVIIAGSVGTSNVISSFANRAGTESAWYLAALGEQICCEYANGVIKVTSSGGSNYYTVYNGTSFSAPQIAGAVALLRQAFPNLSAAQAVQLLLTTATDAGTSGEDTTYGKGVLNIAAAFTAQGSTSIGSSQMAMGDTSVVTSPAMGDAISAASLPTVMMDSYARAFNVNLASGMRAAQIMPRLTMALTARQESLSLAQGRVSLAFTVDANGRNQGNPWRGALRLSREDADASRVLAARMIAQLSARTRMGLAYSMGADGLVASLQGQDRPAFMIAANPLEDAGFARHGQTAFALRQDLGARWGGLWGLTLSAERADGQIGAPWRTTGMPDPMQRSDAVYRFGAAADGHWGAWDAALGLSWMAEQRGVLGARLNPVFGAQGADSWFADASVGWRPMGDLRIGAGWRQGYTAIHAGTMLQSGSHLWSNGWVVDAALANALKPGDTFSIRVSQPLRVAAGGANLWLPLAYDYDTQTTTWGTQRLNLRPHGREIATELAWHLPLWGGSANANLFWRHNPGHYATLPVDRGWSVGWKYGF
ncbi:S8 family serine peptidase [Novosphingobium sp. FSY-8]|uniref:S8 family serine peptidase n=1 Tax=Novosphingobium ovatum TaxID=1908523 RepID=A0ABW9XH22_9SPHN|nr:S8 family peptidase [Novosphingobium ovatum]NBC37867.1 S8 family serine peptidase [Novosphingobium ovatum]